MGRALDDRLSESKVAIKKKTYMMHLGNCAVVRGGLQDRVVKDLGLLSNRRCQATGLVVGSSDGVEEGEKIHCELRVEKFEMDRKVCKASVCCRKDRTDGSVFIPSSLMAAKGVLWRL
jgi:hypothetical protein